ncbi:MAG TPA: hypothetical protein VD886_06620 [Herpetosiphonaceae bacterium]|nr:hypothetical protein [Herpetosiphonaceae bacterium]
MDIKRETLAQGADLEELRQKLKAEAESRGLGTPQGNNEYGSVYVSVTHDLRIERDSGNWGQYRLMLTHKLQPKKSLFGKLKRG